MKLTSAVTVGSLPGEAQVTWEDPVKARSVDRGSNHVVASFPSNAVPAARRYRACPIDGKSLPLYHSAARHTSNEMSTGWYT
jgi:hypothetical protein